MLPAKWNCPGRQEVCRINRCLSYRHQSWSRHCSSSFNLAPKPDAFVKTWSWKEEKECPSWKEAPFIKCILGQDKIYSPLTLCQVFSLEQTGDSYQSPSNIKNCLINIYPKPRKTLWFFLFYFAPFAFTFFFFFWLHSVACGILVPDQGWNPCPLHWKWGVLTTEQPGKPIFTSLSKPLISPFGSISKIYPLCLTLSPPLSPDLSNSSYQCLSLLFSGRIHSPNNSFSLNLWPF